MSEQPVLSAHARRALARMSEDLRRIFEGRLAAVVASGGRSSVVFATPILPGDLDAVSALVHTWHHEGLDTPLVLTPDEFRRSVDAFPVEYQAIIDHHTVVAGTPPFGEVNVDAAHLRQACEVQAKSHLIHLRQGWMEAAGDEEKLAELIAESAGPLRAILSNVARLEGQSGPLAGAALARLPEPLVGDVLALAEEPERAHALVPRLPEYLHATEQLWAFIDRWR